MSDEDFSWEKYAEFFDYTEIGSEEWVVKINEICNSDNNVERILANINLTEDILSLLENKVLDFNFRLMLLEKLDEETLMIVLHKNSMENSPGKTYFNFIKSERVSVIVIFSLLRLGNEGYLPLILKLIKNIKNKEELDKILTFKEGDAEVLVNLIKSENVSESIIYSLLKLGDECHLPLILELMKNIKSYEVLNKIRDFKKGNAKNLVKLKLPETSKDHSDILEAPEQAEMYSEKEMLLCSLGILNPEDNNLEKEVERILGDMDDTEILIYCIESGDLSKEVTLILLGKLDDRNLMKLLRENEFVSYISYGDSKYSYFHKITDETVSKRVILCLEKSYKDVALVTIRRLLGNINNINLLENLIKEISVPVVYKIINDKISFLKSSNTDGFDPTDYVDFSLSGIKKEDINGLINILNENYETLLELSKKIDQDLLVTIFKEEGLHYKARLLMLELLDDNSFEKVISYYVDCYDTKKSYLDYIKEQDEDFSKKVILCIEKLYKGQHLDIIRMLLGGVNNIKPLEDILYETGNSAVNKIINAKISFLESPEIDDFDDFIDVSVYGIKTSIKKRDVNGLINIINKNDETSLELLGKIEQGLLVNLFKEEGINYKMSLYILELLDDDNFEKLINYCITCGDIEKSCLNNITDVFISQRVILCLEKSYEKNYSNIIEKLLGNINNLNLLIETISKIKVPALYKIIQAKISFLQSSETAEPDCMYYVDYSLSSVKKRDIKGMVGLFNENNEAVLKLSKETDQDLLLSLFKEEGLHYKVKLRMLELLNDFNLGEIIRDNVISSVFDESYLNNITNEAVSKRTLLWLEKSYSKISPYIMKKLLINITNINLLKEIIEVTKMVDLHKIIQTRISSLESFEAVCMCEIGISVEERNINRLIDILNNNNEILSRLSEKINQDLLVSLFEKEGLHDEVKLRMLELLDDDNLKKVLNDNLAVINFPYSYVNKVTNQQLLLKIIKLMYCGTNDDVTLRIRNGLSKKITDVDKLEEIQREVDKYSFRFSFKKVIEWCKKS